MKVKLVVEGKGGMASMVVSEEEWDDEFVELIEREAAARGVTIDALIRQALDQAIKEWKGR